MFLKKKCLSSEKKTFSHHFGCTPVIIEKQIEVAKCKFFKAPFFFPSSKWSVSVSSESKASGEWSLLHFLVFGGPHLCFGEQQERALGLGLL